jgi:uncharacterized protein DUF4157
MPGRSTHPYVVRSDRQQSPSPQRFGHDFSKIPIHSPVGAGHGTERAPSLVAFAESGVNEPGIALPVGPRAMLENHLGGRFGDVRIHTGPSAIAATRQLRAVAYTLGPDIAFGDGFYAPHTDDGLRLLSHELTHVIQTQNTPKQSAEAASSTEETEPLEQEARAASAALGRDKTTIRERLTKRTPLCHPIYISSHGDKGYLAAAAKFYSDWGYSPIQRDVPSIEEVVKDLAQQSSIDHITIVSHAESDHVMMEFINGGPDTIIKSDWEVSTVANLTSLERHLVDVSTLGTVIQYVQKAHPGVLDHIGSMQDPVVRQFIWWVVERVRATRAGYPAAAGIRIERTATEHTELYRNTLRSAKASSGAGSGSGTQAAPAEADLNSAEDAVVEQAKRWTWDKQPPKPEEVPGHEQRLKESPSASILRVMQNPEFLDNLAKAQKKIGGSSWIEIQGCRAGKDKDYLKAIQAFFGGAARPRVTAPDWYQAFGHFGWTGIPDSDKEAQAQWERKDNDVPRAFSYWFKIITKKDPPKKPTHHDLLDYLRAGNVLPLAYPGATGSAHLLLLKGKELSAMLAWLSRHSYLLTKQPDIQSRLFSQKDFGKNVEAITIDWLEEHYNAAGQIALRPSLEYDKHIIEVK